MPLLFQLFLKDNFCCFGSIMQFCALMLTWKFDAQHAWMSPIALRQNKPPPLTSPFDPAPQLFLRCHSSPSSSWCFFLSYFFSRSSSKMKCAKI